MKSNLLFGSINIVLKMKVLPWPLMWWRTLVAVTMFFMSFFASLSVFVFVWSVFEELARGTPLVITDAGGGDTLCGDWNNTRNKNNTRNYTRRRWSEITVNSLQYWGKKTSCNIKAHAHEMFRHICILKSTVGPTIWCKYNYTYAPQCDKGACQMGEHLNMHTLSHIRWGKN